MLRNLFAIIFSDFISRLEKGEISPESTRLNKQDQNKLDGMNERYEISEEEYACPVGGQA